MWNMKSTIKAKTRAMKPGEKLTHAHYCKEDSESGMNTSDVLLGIFVAILIAFTMVY